MDSTVDPMVLGPLMIILTTAWFGGMSWAGMHEDERPRRHTEVALVGAPTPWWICTRALRNTDGSTASTSEPLAASDSFT